MGKKPRAKIQENSDKHEFSATKAPVINRHDGNCKCLTAALRGVDMAQETGAAI
jgi:hypothetical protein